MVPVCTEGGASENRCRAQLQKNRATGGQEAVENNLLFRGQNIQETGSRKGRARWRARINQEKRRRSRRSLPCPLQETNRESGMGLVRHTQHVPETWVRDDCAPRNQLPADAKNHPP